MLIVFASGNGSNFAQLAERFKIDLLVCDRRDAFVLSRAQSLNVPQTLCCKAQFETRRAFDCALADIINRATAAKPSPHIIVLAGFMHILGSDFFAQLSADIRIVNLHPAHREDYKGARAYEFAVKHRFPRWGLSIHEATPELDSGPLLASYEATVEPTDTAETLRARMQRFEHSLLIQTIRTLLGDQAHAASRPIP